MLTAAEFSLSSAAQTTLRILRRMQDVLKFCMKPRLGLQKRKVIMKCRCGQCQLLCKATTLASVLFVLPQIHGTNIVRYKDGTALQGIYIGS